VKRLALNNVPTLPMPVPDRPWRTVGMDLLALPATPAGNNYLAVFTDHFSRYVEAVALPDKQAATVAKAFFDSVVCRHGVPQHALSDCGTEFTNKVMEAVAALINMGLTTTTPFHPQANGLVERFNAEFVHCVQSLPHEQMRNNWDRYIPTILFAYAAHHHRRLGCSPFFALYGRDPVTPETLLFADHPRNVAAYDQEGNVASQIRGSMPALWALIHARLEEMHHINESAAEARARAVVQRFAPGQRVLVHMARSGEADTDLRRNKTLSAKLQRQWRGVYTVVRALTPVTYELQGPAGTILCWAGFMRLAPDNAAANGQQ
jgi:transposase InsO family protein